MHSSSSISVSHRYLPFTRLKMATEQARSAAAVKPWNYSNRVVLRTILGRSDGGLEFVHQRVVVGGWVKSSKEVKKEVAPAAVGDGKVGESGPNDVSCAEILQTRIPFLRTICKILGGNNFPLREKLESVIPKLTPSIAFLQISDGSCVASLQVVVDSSIYSPRYLLPTGTCILVEGELKQSSGQGKHVIELKAEKILHIGTVDHDYPLSKKRLPLDSLRDIPHFRPRTTTVASVTRIHSALTSATHSFFQNHGFIYVQVPTITTMDCEGLGEKFQVTTLLGKADKIEKNVVTDTEGVSLEVIKTAIKDKSNKVEELKRSESNKEALAAAVQDLRKTNELASQLEAREKSKPEVTPEFHKVNISEDFFSQQTYLTSTGRLHLESYACALGNVYSFGPRFRADKGQSAKHVAEMWMVEVEMAFSQLEDAMNCVDDFFKFLCKWILENCHKDMMFVTKRIDKTSIDRLQSMLSNSFQKISYTEAVATLEKITEKEFETKPQWGIAFTAEHLSYLVDEIYEKPILVYNYPKEVKPFYVRLNDDGKTVAAFDVILPKVGMMISGSQNEERINMLNTRIKELGIPKEQYEWYLDLRRQGTVKHSGFNIALDIMVLFTSGLTDVRDVIPFPTSFGKTTKTNQVAAPN